MIQQLPVTANTTIKKIRKTGDNARKIIVIGNGMIGFRFCQRLAEEDQAGLYEIVVFGEEPRPAYDRVNLTDYFSTKTAHDLELANWSWYEKRDIRLVTSNPVVSIDSEKKTIKAKNGDVEEYDILVLATGARPYIPDIPGVDIPGVYVYRTIEDLQAIKSRAESSETAAVMGGGLLGLEAAKALLDLNLQPTVLQLSNALLSKQLDFTSGSILRTHIEKAGIDVRVSHKTKAISEMRDGKLLLEFNDKKPSLITDMVVISAGIVPRDDLCASANINHNRGVIVSDTLQSTNPDIYAIGECVRHRGRTYGLVAPGYEMADCLVKRLMGDDEAYFREGDETARLKVVGINVAVMGRFNADAYTVSMNSQGKRKKLIISGRHLIGASVVGDWPELNRVQEAVEKEELISNKQIQRFREKGQIWRNVAVSDNVVDWPDTQTICNCMRINKGQLVEYQKEVLDRDGQCSLETLMQCSRAGTVCGSCKPLVIQYVAATSDQSTSDMSKISLGLKAPRGNRGFLVLSLIAMMIASLFIFIGPLPYAESVSSWWYEVDQIWRKSIYRQWTGFVLLGISTIGLILSLRKRIKWFNWLDYGWYRLLHGITGAFSLVGLIVHTGMRMGDNLNLLLMIVFLGLNVLGATAGIVTTLENGQGELARLARKSRPMLTWMHIIFFWPLPVLLVFHILAAYMY